MWETNKLVGWLLLGRGIKQACLAVGVGGMKGRGVLLWKTTGDKRMGWKMRGRGELGSEAEYRGFSCMRMLLIKITIIIIILT